MMIMSTFTFATFSFNILTLILLYFYFICCTFTSFSMQDFYLQQNVSTAWHYHVYWSKSTANSTKATETRHYLQTTIQNQKNKIPHILLRDKTVAGVQSHVCSHSSVTSLPPLLSLGSASTVVKPRWHLDWFNSCFPNLQWQTMPWFMQPCSVITLLVTLLLRWNTHCVIVWRRKTCSS